MREKETEFIKTIFWEKTNVLQENTIFCKRTSFVSKSRVSYGNNILWENEKFAQAKAKFLGKMQYFARTQFCKWMQSFSGLDNICKKTERKYSFSGKQYLLREPKEAKAMFPGKHSILRENAKFLCDLNILQEKAKDLRANAKFHRNAIFCERIQKVCKRMKGNFFLNHYGMVYNYGYEI